MWATTMQMKPQIQRWRLFNGHVGMQDTQMYGDILELESA